MFVSPWAMARARPASSISASGSTAITVPARSASGMVNCPVPQPMSMTVLDRSRPKQIGETVDLPRAGYPGR